MQQMQSKVQSQIEHGNPLESSITCAGLHSVLEEVLGSFVVGF